MIRCKGVAELLLSGEVERLGWRRRWEVRLHVAICAMCRRLLRQIGQMSQGAKGMGGDADAGLEERLMRQLSKRRPESE